MMFAKDILLARPSEGSVPDSLLAKPSNGFERAPPTDRLGPWGRVK